MTSPEHQDLGYLINTVSRLLKQSMAAELSPLELTPQQAAVLLAASVSETPPTITETASRLGMDRPTMTGVVERLIRDGWVETTPNPTDGRSRLVRNTEKATSALPFIRRASTLVGDRLLEGFTAKDAQMLRLLLNRITETAIASENE